MRLKLVFAVITILLLTQSCSKSPTAPEVSDSDPQYLIFQLFTYAKMYSNPQDPEPPLSETMTYVRSNIDDILSSLGGVRGNGQTRQLGFAVGPLILDQTNEELRQIIRESYEIAEEKNIAVVFHIDDSMFWMRRSDLWQDPKNVEWSDWNGTVYPQRFVDWIGDPRVKLAPQMCYNSPAILKELSRIARDVMGAEIKRGIDHLKANNKEYLFAGVIAGWETHIADYSTGYGGEMVPPELRLRIGYNALTNLGFSAQNPPSDFHAELEKVVHDWAEFWAKELNQAGIPQERLYTHFAGPTWQGFNQYSRPGFSIYTPGQFGGIYAEREKHSNPPWALSEGTNLDPDMTSFSWEAYLDGIFGHGGKVATIFAWHEKERSPYGRSTNSTGAIAADKKFLSGK